MKRVFRPLKELDSEIYTCNRTRCGFCCSDCPTYIESIYESYSARGRMLIARGVLERKIEFSKELANNLYSCTMCGYCNFRCTLDPIAVIEALRAELVERGIVPPGIKEALTSTYKYGNPWERSQSKRDEWTSDVEVKKISGTNAKNFAYLYFVGCTPSYDPRCQEVARSMVRVLNKAGVDFAILGVEEKCCGGPSHRMGELGLFEQLAKENIATFKKHDVKKVIVTSPHCFHTFKNEYPALGLNLEVQHYTQFISALIEGGKIELKNGKKRVVCYQDPCYLGRLNQIYEEPRNILRSIHGINLVEMYPNREHAMCCGGGGGRIWMKETSERRPSLDRARKAIELGVDTIATACPFCLMNFEDAVKVLGKENIQVKDVIELVEEAI